jgi:Fe-S-cluster-containing dehydrogenase component
MARMKFLCDADRCIECNACVTACQNENEVPWGSIAAAGLAAIGRNVLSHHKPSASARPNSTPPAKNNTSG